MGLYDIKPRFRAILTPIADGLSWVHPDIITLLGLAASGFALSAIVYAPQHPWMLFLVPWWLFVRIASNALDGLVAQRTGKARPFGEVLNEGVDRLSDVTLLLGLGLTPWASFAQAAWTTIAVLLSSYAGLLGKSVGVGREYGGVLGKADRMLWMGLTALIAWKTGLQPMHLAGREFRSVFDVMLTLFLPLALITACQRVQRIHARLNQAGGAR